MSAETWPEAAEQEGRALGASALGPVTAGASDLEHCELPGNDVRIRVDSSAAGQLAELLRDYGCLRTLTTGARHGELAMVVASTHARRPKSVNTVIDSDHTPAQLALPGLLAKGTELDFALIEGPRVFEDAFLELLYLDRMLVPGGLLAIAGPQRDVVNTLLQYIARARAYELRSTPGASLTVLRKLGRHRPRNPPIPESWRRAGDEVAAPASPPAPMVFPGRADAELEFRTANRDDYLAHARAADLEARARVLAERLLQAEAENVRELTQLRHQLNMSEAGREQAEYWLARIASSASWRLTSPLRSLKKHIRPSGR